MKKEGGGGGNQRKDKLSDHDYLRKKCLKSSIEVSSWDHFSVFRLDSPFLILSFSFFLILPFLSHSVCFARIFYISTTPNLSGPIDKKIKKEKKNKKKKTTRKWKNRKETVYKDKIKYEF